MMILKAGWINVVMVKQHLGAVIDGFINLRIGSTSII
jgi:hypothetical protein